MIYRYAKNLHNGDEVTIKNTGRRMLVVTTTIQLGRKQVEILCEDGNWYNHKEIR